MLGLIFWLRVLELEYENLELSNIVRKAIRRKPSFLRQNVGFLVHFKTRDQITYHLIADKFWSFWLDIISFANMVQMDPIYGAQNKNAR